jgi:hypothetical protein
MVNARPEDVHWTRNIKAQKLSIAKEIARHKTTMESFCGDGRLRALIGQ